MIDKEKKAEYSKKWYEANKEKIAQHKKKYYQANKEKIAQRKKKYREANKEKLVEQRKKHYQANKEKEAEYSKKWYEANKEKAAEYSKKYYQANKEKLAEYQRERIKTDSLFKMKICLRTRTSVAFKNKGYKKNSKTEKILGISYEKVKKHIGRQFQNGMTWSNYGEWHIDHIIPLSSAKTEAELLKLCHYRNLQPLWAADNMSKGAKIPQVQIQIKL
tara:strand:+ start:21 stop:674 length:654 start_codon:yes stop_codon:yes gene_type:complete